METRQRTGRSVRTLCAALTALAVTALGAGAARADARSAPAPHSGGTRVSAWSPAMTTGGPSFENRTIRMVVHSSVAGTRARITLSDRYSPQPLRVAAADIAIQASGGAAEPGTTRHLTFGGARGTEVPAGAERVSDSAPISVEAGQNLLVSLYLPTATGPSTWHSDAFDTTWTAPGDHTGDTGADAFTDTSTSWYYLAGLDVLSPTAKGTVVAFGDSITDGYHSSTGTYTRWPDLLATRLADRPGPQRLGVVDAGIGGNRVLTDVPNPWQGVSALKRFGHDALGQPGVKDVILLEGINDIGNDAGPDGGPLTVRHLIDGYRALIRQARAAHVRIIGATLMPDKGNGYYSPAAEAVRQGVNEWIRTAKAFDGVIDFDRAMRDPADPAALDPDYDSGDHIHPDDAGMRAMADAVDLRLLHP
ncbi:SGNH/GDSL hydrolase family protein [Streptomyces sp. SID5785]|uniref:SGNH/GDSL hydrolase family protein n=1 Tax=Streptomyces sp. SID5785 TaxID=2690309 RepID=UPI0013611C50|nr:SGNH/GDSL hydrolase family protein [Streptomyces sp. SID5785]MZD09001.1 SGNH/GDSL hydrolase family protein [Streptomyces sp. SID5785]